MKKMKDLVLVSVDDHVVEPADMFTRHLSAQCLAAAPHVAVNPDGRAVWLFEDRPVSTIGRHAAVGRPHEQWGLTPSGFSDLREGTYNASRRIDDMNANGILGSVNFPSFPGFAGQAFWQARDRTNAARVVRAYNDWHIDEWCASAPGRFIPNAILPLWDIDLTLAEVQRVLDKGCRSICFPDNPSAYGLSAIHDDLWQPLWQLCNDAGVVLNCHLDSERQTPHASPASPIDAWLTAAPFGVVNSAADWLSASFWFYYPQLKVVLTSSGIGWLPYFLERADQVFRQHSAWTRANYGGLLPSEVFRRHFMISLVDDPVGLAHCDRLGTDSILWAADYPHADCNWPNTPETLWESLNTLAEDDIRKITHENAMRLWHYNPFATLAPQDCTVAALRRQSRHVDITPMPIQRHSEDRLMQRRVTSGDVLSAAGGLAASTPAMHHGREASKNQS